MLKLVAPTIGVDYQIETGVGGVYPNQISIVTTSVIGPFVQNLINVAFPWGMDINATVRQIFIMFMSQKFMMSQRDTIQLSLS